MPSGVAINRVRFGIVGINVTNTTYYLDGIAITDTGFLGPANPTYAAPLLRSNVADLGTNNTTVTSVNSGDSVNYPFQIINTTNPLIFSNTQSAHGSLSYLFQPTSGVADTVVWTGLGTTAAAMRAYVYFTASPPSSTEFLQLTTSAIGTFDLLARFALTSANKVQVFDRSVTQLWTSTASISLNTWYRFEVFAQLGGTPTTATINAAFYSLDNASAIESFSTNTADMGSENIEWMRFGKINTTASTDPIYFDEIAVQQNAAGFIGAYTGPPSAPTAYAGTIPHLGWGRDI